MTTCTEHDTIVASAIQSIALFGLFDRHRAFDGAMLTLFEHHSPGATGVLLTWAESYGFTVAETGHGVCVVMPNRSTIAVHR
jgi:hypothetical protein